MRTGLIVMIALVGCGKSAEDRALEAAKAEEAADLAKKKAEGKIPETQKPPVAGNEKIPCERLINLDAFQTGLAEKEPFTIRDDTKKDGEAAASCSLIRGGKTLTKAEQDALRKTKARLGVLAGDPLCQVTAYCYTLESQDHFQKSCAESVLHDHHMKQDDTMGSYACVQVTEQGEKDVMVFKFYDEDTKCLLKVSANGPNDDNDVIRNCAKIARETIGPEQIKTTPMPPKADADAGSGSAK